MAKQDKKKGKERAEEKTKEEPKEKDALGSFLSDLEKEKQEKERKEKEEKKKEPKIISQPEQIKAKPKPMPTKEPKAEPLEIEKARETAKQRVEKLRSKSKEETKEPIKEKVEEPAEPEAEKVPEVEPETVEIPGIEVKPVEEQPEHITVGISDLDLADKDWLYDGKKVEPGTMDANRITDMKLEDGTILKPKDRTVERELHKRFEEQRKAEKEPVKEEVTKPKVEELKEFEDIDDQVDYFSEILTKYRKLAEEGKLDYEAAKTIEDTIRSYGVLAKETMTSEQRQDMNEVLGEAKEIRQDVREDLLEKREDDLEETLKVAGVTVCPIDEKPADVEEIVKEKYKETKARIKKKKAKKKKVEVEEEEEEGYIPFEDDYEFLRKAKGEEAQETLAIEAFKLYKLMKENPKQYELQRPAMCKVVHGNKDLQITGKELDYYLDKTHPFNWYEHPEIMDMYAEILANKPEKAEDSVSEDSEE